MLTMKAVRTKLTYLFLKTLVTDLSLASTAMLPRRRHHRLRQIFLKKPKTLYNQANNMDFISYCFHG